MNHNNNNEHEEIEIVYDNFQLEKCKNGEIKLANINYNNNDDNNNEKFINDNLYHLSLNIRDYNFYKLFNNVKFICMGGTKKRMYNFIKFVSNELNIIDNNNDNDNIENIIEHSNRYAMYKYGPILAVSHGMGTSSISILLHEIFKLLFYAKCTNVTIFRIGTSGGIDVKPGTVVITKNAVDELLRPYYELHILGKIIRRPVKFNECLINELMSIANEQQNNNNYDTIIGTTMCAYDFYESQSRIDGSICNYTNMDKINWLKKLKSMNVKNIEMESLAFGSMCYYLNIDAAIVCVTLVDRLSDDQVKLINDQQSYNEFQKRPQKLILEFIKKRLSLK